MKQLFMHCTGNQTQVEFNTNEFNYVTLKSVYLPHCEYNINQYNNLLYWRDNTVNSNIVSQIPFGNYNINQLIKAINIVLIADKTDANNYSIEIINNSSADNIEYKVRFLADAGGISLYYNENSILNILGFNNINYPSALSIKADNVYNLSRNFYIFQFNFSGRSLIYNSIYGDKPVFISPVNVNYGDIINNDKYTEQTIKLYNKVQFIKIKLLDSNFKNINNNNVPYDLLLEFK